MPSGRSSICRLLATATTLNLSACSGVRSLPAWKAVQNEEEASEEVGKVELGLLWGCSGDRGRVEGEATPKTRVPCANPSCGAPLIQKREKILAILALFFGEWIQGLRKDCSRNSQFWLNGDHPVAAPAHLLLNLPEQRLANESRPNQTDGHREGLVRDVYAHCGTRALKRRNTSNNVGGGAAIHAGPASPERMCTRSKHQRAGEVRSNVI